MYKPGKEESTRIEFRSPDPACNPYLAFAAMLAAGLKGIEEEYELPPEAVEQHLRDERGRTPRRRHRVAPRGPPRGDRRGRTIRVLREALGDHVVEYLIRNKREEWDGYKAYVTPYELERYLPLL